MKKIIKKLADRLIKQSIIFESRPFFSDNTRPVYEELVRRGYGKKYNLIWYVSETEYAYIKNGKAFYFNPRSRKTLKDKINSYSFSRPKCIICCNIFLSSDYYRLENGEKPRSFYLTHGTPMKSVRAYYSAPAGIDYSISPSCSLNNIISKEFNIPEDKVFATGFPRNDVFFKSSKHLNQMFGWNYNKIIIWYPTYRQNKNHSINLEGSSLPLIHDEENALQLNDIARKHNVLIILKPHFAQDVSLIRKVDLSNIKLIDDSFFEQNNITSYELLAGSDALLSDYSSVYFDYTLHDRPIGVIWEDLEEYTKFPGFALDIDYYLKGAEKIFTINDLCSFIVSVANDEDFLKESRREIRDQCNYANDGQSTKRVVDFIVKNASL